MPPEKLPAPLVVLKGIWLTQLVSPKISSMRTRTRWTFSSPIWTKILARRVDATVVLVSEDGRRRRVRRGPGTVEVHGRPSEVLLGLFGRREAAAVHAIGDPDAVDAWEAAALGP